MCSVHAMHIRVTSTVCISVSTTSVSVIVAAEFAVLVVDEQGPVVGQALVVVLRRVAQPRCGVVSVV